MQLPSVNCGPPTTTSGICFTDTLPREFDAVAVPNTFDSAIKPTFDRSELKGTKAIILKRNVSRDDKINVIAIPFLHLNDPPLAEEWIQSLRHGANLCGLTFKLTGGPRRCGQVRSRIPARPVERRVRCHRSGGFSGKVTRS